MRCALQFSNKLYPLTVIFLGLYSTNNLKKKTKDKLAFICINKNW